MISHVFLTWNSISNMRGALDSVKGIVDETIAVDSFSGDGTVDVLNEYGAKVYQKKFELSFSDLRNFGIEKANGEWILILDTDEVLSEATKALVPELVKDPKHDCYVFRRRNYIGGVLLKDKDYHFRLFRNYCRYVGRIHEQLTGYKSMMVVQNAEVIHTKTREGQNERNLKYDQINKEIKKIR